MFKPRNISDAWTSLSSTGQKLEGSVREPWLQLGRQCHSTNTTEAMKCLTKLKTIDICNCPVLKERCNEESGLEWHKISHIPNIVPGDW
ncbi:hypothetical protein ACFX1Q_010273 [Malus domestica]